MRPPAVPDDPPPVLRIDELERLLAACAGTSFEDRRDTAIIRLLASTGMRRGECVGLRVEDVDFDHEVALVLGKGRRPRACPFDRQTSRALDRYLRAGKLHFDAASPWLWLGKRGRLTDRGRPHAPRRLEEPGDAHPLRRLRRRRARPRGVPAIASVGHRLRAARL